MNKFKIVTDGKQRTSKPLPTEVGIISKTLTKTIEVSIEEFSSLMSKGYTWTPAIFKNNKRSNANWLEQQVFALDFDNGVTPEEIFKRCDRLGLKPNVLYSTFSDSKEHRKFRLIFILDQIITDKKLRKNIQLALMHSIGDVDEACKDAARLYYGGTQSVILNRTFSMLDDVMKVVDTQIIADDNMKTRKIVLDSSPYNSIIEVGLKDSFLKPVKNFDFQRLSNEVKIFNDFVEGKWLTHPQLFGLATSMFWIEGGYKLMRNTMIKFNKLGKTHYTNNNFAILPYISKKKYQPQRLDNYSPYKEDWVHTNLITAVRDVKGYIERVEKAIPTITLKEAENKMKTIFREVRDAKDTNIHILKLPTGIGKTRMLETVPFTIALPTNGLKDEVYDRVLVKKTKTPVMPELSDPSLNAKINHLYKIGMDKLATKMISDIARGKMRGVSTLDTIACNDYLKDLRDSYKSTDCVVTTHTRAIYSEFQSDTIVFDEDPLMELLSIKSFKLSDLTNLRATVENKDLDKLITILSSITPDILTKVPSVLFDIQALITNTDYSKFTSNVIAAFDADFIIRNGKNPDEFYYIHKQFLPEDKKIIIMSATIPVAIYKKMYGDRVKVYDITNVETKGKLIQYTKKSYSRASIQANKEELLHKLNTSIPTITFKNFIKLIPNAVQDIYFGNVSGYDSLKGLDINVVGTPHINNIVYMLIGSVMGEDLRAKDFVMEYRMIEWGGFKFKFNCYQNETLMNIQLSLIESTLIQSVGRARILREDCKVYLYSNLPLRISSEFINL